MKRQRLVIGSIVLALATSVFPLTTAADAAVVRHHFVHHTAAHHGGAYRQVSRGDHAHRSGWVSGGWRDGAWVGYGDSGWIGSYYNGYGSYKGYAGDFCGTIQWTLDLCGPHSP